MLYWRFHFKNEIPVNCLITQWKWTYILEFGPWRWSALNMRFVDKWPSRCKDNGFFEIRRGRQKFAVRSIKCWFISRGVALPVSTSPKKLVGRGLTFAHVMCWLGWMDGFQTTWIRKAARCHPSCHVSVTHPRQIIIKASISGGDRRGCKHSKMDQESAPVYESHDFLGQTTISSSKMLFKIYYFSWWPLLSS